MKRQVLGILNLITGILLTIYLLLQNGTIKINALIKNNQYTKSFDTFMKVFMLILIIIILILLVFSILNCLKRKKDQLSITSEILCISVLIVSAITLFTSSMVTILSPILCIGGILLIVQK